MDASKNATVCGWQKSKYPRAIGAQSMAEDSITWGGGIGVLESPVYICGCNKSIACGILISLPPPPQKKMLKHEFVFLVIAHHPTLKGKG